MLPTYSQYYNNCCRAGLSLPCCFSRVTNCDRVGRRSCFARCLSLPRLCIACLYPCKAFPARSSSLVRFCSVLTELQRLLNAVTYVYRRADPETTIAASGSDTPHNPVLLRSFAVEIGDGRSSSFWCVGFVFWGFVRHDHSDYITCASGAISQQK